MLSLGVIVRVCGRFPKEGTFIIMMNHSSFLDVFLFPLIPRGAYSGVTAEENFKYPIFSLLIRRLKAIPINRNNKNMAIRSIKMAEEVLMNGVHIGILPEGSRTKSGSIQPFKKGGFHMAINTKTSIIPVGISGAFDFKPKHRWWLRPGLININIGDPIDCEQYSLLKIEELMDLTQLKIRNLSGQNHKNK